MRLRFPKSGRLARSSEFDKLKREGVSFHGKFMVVSVIKSLSPSAPARVGIITSRRVGGAVARNKVRRRLREIFRHARPELLDDIWMVIVARQYATRATFDDLRREWRQLARRGGVLKPEAPAPCSS